MKTKTKIGITIIIVILTILFYFYWTEWRFEKITVGGSTMYYVEDYRDHYSKVKTKVRRVFTTNVVKIVYLLPGQKEKKMAKIKEDVINELENLIDKHGNIFSKYEISDDFKRVRIYEASRNIDSHKRDEIDRGVPSQIQSLIGLYHNIKEGHPEGLGQIVTYIKYSG